MPNSYEDISSNLKVGRKSSRNKLPAPKMKGAAVGLIAALALGGIGASKMEGERPTLGDRPAAVADKKHTVPRGNTDTTGHGQIVEGKPGIDTNVTLEKATTPEENELMRKYADSIGKGIMQAYNERMGTDRSLENVVGVAGTLNYLYTVEQHAIDESGGYRYTAQTTPTAAGEDILLARLEMLGPDGSVRFGQTAELVGTEWTIQTELDPATSGYLEASGIDARTFATENVLMGGLNGKSTNFGN